MIRTLIFLILILELTFALGQTGSIRGRIIDAETLEGLPFGNVFINQTTIGVAADQNGDYLLKNIPVGEVLVVFSFVGYSSFQKSLQITENAVISLAIRLVPIKQQLAEVEVKGTRDKEWDANFKKFEKIFFGGGRAGSCKILNAGVIDFKEEKSPRWFTAHASAPLEIENNALGYVLKFFLTEFTSSNEFYRIVGNVQFIEMRTQDEAQVVKWSNNRQMAYNHSTRHLFKAILDNRAKEEGFELYVEKDKGLEHSFRANVFSQALEKDLAPFATDKIVQLKGPNVYEISIPPFIEIHYTRGITDSRVYKDILHPVSWMEVSGGKVLVDSKGVIRNAGAIVISGDLYSSRVGMMLPHDYLPGEIVQVEPKYPLVKSERLREKLYVHTDRHYYYPGETLWFKGYMNYGKGAPRDSLSRVAYVELISPKRETLITKVVRIDNGYLVGMVKLPDSLTSGNYYLRAYTRWMRNYGTGSFYLKTVPILSIYEKIKPLMAELTETCSEGLSIKASRSSSEKADSLALVVQLSDSTERPLGGHFSVSVTNVDEVVPLAERYHILTEFPIQTEKSGHLDFTYPVEASLEISGTLTSKKNKPVAGSVMAIEGNLRNVHTAEANKDGAFALENIVFYDSVKFSFKGTDSNGKEARVLLHRHESPVVDIRVDTTPLRLVRLHEPLFQIPKGARLLKPVIVTGKKILPEIKEKQLYGEPDYVIMGKQLQSTSTGYNLISSLAGKIPGMEFYTFYDAMGMHQKIRVRGGTSTVLGDLEPAIFINGVFVAGGGSGILAYDRLAQINSADVERVEVVTRISSLLGNMGANGAIAVFMKSGYNDKEEAAGPGFIPHYLMGYSMPVAFQLNNPALNPGVSVYQPTVYWNPYIYVDSFSGTVALPSIPLTRAGKYRIVLEGVNELGEPFRGETFVTVEE